WGPGTFQFLIGGNKEGVVAAAGQAGRDVEADRVEAVAAGQRPPFLHVFGIADRDFDRTNRPQWPTPGWVGRNYYLDSIEIENLLLDEDALSAIPENFSRRSAAGAIEKLSATAIRARMHSEATGRLWWMTCKQFLAEYNLLRKLPFPGDAGLATMGSLAAAEAYILAAPWFGSTANALQARTAQAHVHGELTRISSLLQAALSSPNDWRTLFAGKEIFEPVAHWVTSGKATLVDVARSVGRIHAQPGRTPTQIVELRDSIRTRTGF
ncbi:MAG: hypothetical protein Q8R82_15025, partial [Hyphomonadaceae bacterium]|nr:hypothetical protein [Hyphomonadaceae bacterium]